MARLPILLHPDPRLKKTCPQVTAFDEPLHQLALDMLETMYEAPGVGLAAPQVGQLTRLFVMDCTDREKDPEPHPIVMINPEIVVVSETLNSYEEGCLSIPEIYAEVTRPAEVRMRYQDIDGQVHEQDFDGLWATCAQHELDHLNGKLFIDYLSSMKRTMITNRMKKVKKGLARAQS